MLFRSTPVDDPSRYGVVPIEVEPHGRVVEFVEKPPPGEAPTNWINAGPYVLEASVVDRIPAGRPVSIERRTFPEMVDDGTLWALQSHAYWIDAGTPASYLRAHLDLVDGTRGREAAVAAEAAVDAAARVEHSVVLSGATVMAGAEVTGSLLLTGAVVEAGASVHDSIVGPRSVVRSGARVEALSVLGDGVEAAPGEGREGARRPEQAD